MILKEKLDEPDNLPIISPPFGNLQKTDSRNLVMLMMILPRTRKSKCKKTRGKKENLHLCLIRQKNNAKT